MVQKCFSKCRKKARDPCYNMPRICQFTKGKRNYCRLNTPYFLDKTNNCAITKKHKKINKKIAKLKIGRFMIKTGDRRRGVFLKTICSDSGACIAFGSQIQKINVFFNNFSNFEYAVSPIKTIGAVSANGFVKEIKYVREGYEAHTVLKSSARKRGDNLMYEYEVGKYINKQNKVFPCFLETYDMFSYNDEASWEHAKTSQTISIKTLETSLYYLNKIDYSAACLKSKYIAILIQHIKNAKSFSKLNKELLNLSSPDKIVSGFNQEMVCVLYQIYMPLASLAKQFTHYDLHQENVLLYEPQKNAYITYRYHFGRVIHTFKSKYIAKIIDYGRSFYDDGDKNSLKTYKTICGITECEPDCGVESGFNILGPEQHPGSFHYISSQKRNISHDLRLATTIRFPRQRTYLQNIVNKVEYTGQYGTKEILSKEFPYKINNVIDMWSALTKIINTPEYKTANDEYFNTLNHVGVFDIYYDGRPMKFTAATD